MIVAALVSGAFTLCCGKTFRNRFKQSSPRTRSVEAADCTSFRGRAHLLNFANNSVYCEKRDGVSEDPFFLFFNFRHPHGAFIQ